MLKSIRYEIVLAPSSDENGYQLLHDSDNLSLMKPATGPLKYFQKSGVKTGIRHFSSLINFGGYHDAYEVFIVLVLELPFDLDLDPGVGLQDGHGCVVGRWLSRLEKFHNLVTTGFIMKIRCCLASGCFARM